MERSTKEESIFVAAQEAMPKDIKSSFDVIVPRWASLEKPRTSMIRGFMTKVVLVTIVIHSIVAAFPRDDYRSLQGTLAKDVVRRGFSLLVTAWRRSSTITVFKLLQKERKKKKAILVLHVLQA